MNSQINLEIPLEQWLNVKICLPNRRRGLALAKIMESSDTHNLHVLMTCDRSLFGEKADRHNLLNYERELQEYIQEAVCNLASLKNDTVLMFAPPRMHGNKCWLGKINEKINSYGHGLQNIIEYSLGDINLLTNFKEARVNPRISFRTEVKIASMPQQVFYSYNISQNGIALILDPQQTEQAINFIENQDYLLEIKLHEGYQMPSLNYRCVNKRHDIITNSMIIGFAMNDSKSQDPKIQENLNLLAWTGWEV